MTKITLNNVSDLTQATTAAVVINSNSNTVETAFDNTLSRDGTAPNSMRANIDMDSNRILNLPTPVNSDEPLRLQDLEDFVGGTLVIPTIPTGGSTGTVLAKTSNADYATAWVNDTTLVGAGTNIQVTGSNPAVIGTVTSPTFAGTVTAGALVVASIPSPAITGTATFAGSTSGTTGLKASAVASGTLTLPAATDTLIGKATTDTLTNKTLDTAGTGNSLLINGLAATANTGTGSVVRATSPTLVTPTLGAATATSVNKVVLTAPATSATLSIADGKTATVSNTLTLAGTDGTVMTFPTTSAAVARTDAANTFTGVQTLSSQPILSSLTASSAVATDGSKGLVSVTNTGTGSNVLATSPTLVTPVLGSANATSMNISGLTASSAVATDGSKTLVSVATTGTGSYVLATTPTLVTPILGTPNSGTLTSCTGLPISTGVSGLGTGVATALAVNASASGSIVRTGTVLQAAPTNPTTTASTTGVMMGLGSTCTLTPSFSTRIRIYWDGNHNNGTNTNSVTTILKFGTGAAPSNGAAATGTTVGTQVFHANPSSSINYAFSRAAIITGLTPGTAYWFDIQFGVSVSGTVGLQNLNFSAEEF